MLYVISRTGYEKTVLDFLAGYIGDSLWEVFSNNHSVFSTIGNAGFSIGSWRGSGSFIAEFIEKQNDNLRFDYMDFYMGHFHENVEAKYSYEYIFSRLKEHGFDWIYEYPSIGAINFSSGRNDGLATYNPNKAMNDEIEENNFLNLLDKVNEERKEKMNNAPTPAIILAYANIYKKYPDGWEAD